MELEGVTESMVQYSTMHLLFKKMAIKSIFMITTRIDRSHGLQNHPLEADCPLESQRPDRIKKKLLMKNYLTGTMKLYLQKIPIEIIIQTIQTAMSLSLRKGQLILLRHL